MRRVLIAVLLTAGALLGGTASAGAGGPTSVLLTNPGNTTAAAVYHTDPRYAELETLLHGPDEAAGDRAGQPGPGASLNVTWLIHDVTVWRLDRLHFDTSGGVWLATSMDTTGPQSASSPSWSRLDGTKRIHDLVASLGLLGSAGAEEAALGQEARQPVVDDPARSAATVASERPAEPAEAGRLSLTGWRWAVPGVLVGLLGLGFGLRRRPETVPRQVLVDRSP